MDGTACPICTLGGTLRAETITEAKQHGGRTVVIHDVPAFVCDRCGTRVFDEQTTVVLEQVYDHVATDQAELYVTRYGALPVAS